MVAANRVAAINAPAYRRYGADTEIQYQPRRPLGLAKLSRILSKREAGTEFDDQPHPKNLFGLFLTFRVISIFAKRKLASPACTSLTLELVATLVAQACVALIEKGFSLLPSLAW